MAVLIAGLALLSGCSGNGNDSEATADTTDTGETVAATTTTETGPPPITAGEEQWVEEIDRLARKMTRASDHVRVYTNAAMTRLAKTYLTCSRSLKRIDSSPGRLEPAARLARQGCKKFERSAKAMRLAVAIDAAGVYSKEQADKYNALVEKALETQGNGINALERARSRADQIAASLPLD